MTNNISYSSKSSFTKYGSTQVFVMVSVIIIALILDTSIVKISGLTLKPSSIWVLGLFAIISGISIVGQNLILRFVKQKVNESTLSQKNLHLHSIYKIALTIHYALAAILIFVILQMIITSRYDVVLLTTTITISYIFAIAMMGVLAYRFLLWFKLNKSYAIFLYGLSSVILAVNASVTLWLVNSILLVRPAQVMPHAVTTSPITYSYQTISILNDAYIATTITSFVIAWFATMVLLNNYSQKMGKFKHRAFLILPLIYFLSQFFILLSLDILTPAFMSNPIFYGLLFTLTFTLSEPIGGIIFGIGFWMIARNIGKDNIVRNYVVISAYGFMLLFTSNQATALTFTPYPPFGLITVSFVGLSSYLILVGIYSSAISISRDAKLRLEIRRLAITNPKLLDSIGTAQLEDETKDKMLSMVKVNKAIMAEETGVRPSLGDDDIKQYLDDVLKEIKGSKKEGFYVTDDQ
jgi:hypothetical protein